MATGFGLQFVRTLHNNAPVVEPYAVSSSYATALFVGDVVRLVNTTGVISPSGELPTIERAATGEILLGVIVGFEANGNNILTGNYNPASTGRIALVNVDPDSVYAAQEDAVGGSISGALVAAYTNVAMIVAAGSTATGLSGTMIDSSTTTASAADLKVVGVTRNADNAAGKVGGAILECMILAPAIKAVDSQS